MDGVGGEKKPMWNVDVECGCGCPGGKVMGKQEMDWS